MRSPAFQFYATDWLGSQRVAMLTLEEEGAYIRLVAYCWQHGSIPSDPDQAARLIGKGASTTLATTVLTMFKPATEPGRMTHDRLERQREEQAAWRAKSAAGGRKSAEKRKGGGKGGSRVVEPPFQPEGNTPTPTPSPEVQEGSCASHLQTLRTRLCRMYSRKTTDAWSYIEEQGLVEVCKRPDAVFELGELQAFKDSLRPDEVKFSGFPKTLGRLLEGWGGALDLARAKETKQAKPFNGMTDEEILREALG